MIDRENFRAASDAAEGWLNTIAMVAHLGEGGNVGAVYELLCIDGGLQDSYRVHSPILAEAQDTLTALSDGPIQWESGRGLGAIKRGPMLPHCWSNAHEAAAYLARLALSELARPIARMTNPEGRPDVAEDIQDTAAHLVKTRWRAFVLPAAEQVALQERIRRERAKFLAQPFVDPYLPAESPALCAKRMKRHLETVKRYIEKGQLRRKIVSARLWQLHRDDVQKLGGKVD